jgi:hypothetical protein
MIYFQNFLPEFENMTPHNSFLFLFLIWQMINFYYKISSYLNMYV